MQTLTEQAPSAEECRKLAECWPEHFECALAGELRFNLGVNTICYSFLHDIWQADDCSIFLPIDPALGLAALAAKCIEIEPRLCRIPAIEEGCEWAIGKNVIIGELDGDAENCFTLPDFTNHADTPWSALLATRKEEADAD